MQYLEIILLSACKTMYRRFSTSIAKRADFSHVVIGGGAVGTAIASELQAQPGNNVVLIEQHDLLGMETTSRNSEVIHAGIYYPQNTLKAQLCIRGKEFIYGKLDPKIVLYNRCKKWVVAQNPDDVEYLKLLEDNAKALGVPVNFVAPSTARRTQPLVKAEYGALESPTTGIISAHDLLMYYHTAFENTEGTVATNTKVTGIEYERAIPQYRLTCTEQGTGDLFEITADNVVNSAGLYAQQVSNMLLPEERHFKSYFAKGSYFDLAPVKSFDTSIICDRLIYPCPSKNVASLGTHLTFDMGGQIRFGPDLEWVDEIVQDAAELNYEVSTDRVEEVHRAIQDYYPDIKIEDLRPSYSGVRPKLLSKKQNAKKLADFYIKEEEGFDGFVNLIGIESPGLTSSWAIGEYVRKIYHD